jgi:hypothetical protein
MLHLELLDHPRDRTPEEEEFAMTGQEMLREVETKARKEGIETGRKMVRLAFEQRFGPIPSSLDEALGHINARSRCESSGSRFSEAPARGSSRKLLRAPGSIRLRACAGESLVPVPGWWEQRRLLKTEEMKFSLVVSVFGPGVYSAIRPRIEAEAMVTIDV